MKKNLFFIFIYSIINGIQAQGLEKIYVEKYYISDEKDEAVAGKSLPTGSVTYRIYVDMLPGYRFQAAFGIPGHELKFSTTTRFYNNEDFGGVIANVIPDRNLGDKSVMLDSWLSAGGASEGNLGILRIKDNEENTVVNKNGILQNTFSNDDFSIKVHDGLVTGFPASVTSFGIDSIISVFNKKSEGAQFSTSNGSWATMNGSIGPDSIDNKVLIAQITTDGIFTFELNVQIGTPGGEIEQYVAKNPVKNEILSESLNFSSLSERKTDIKKTKNKLNNN